MRYLETVKLIDSPFKDKKKRRYETMLYPSFEVKNTDNYINSTLGDRCDNVAFDYYEDQRLWWVIARANKLPVGSFQIPPGFRIRIPDLSHFEIQELLRERQF